MKRIRPKHFFFILIGLIVAGVAAMGAGYYFQTKKVKEQTKVLGERLADAEVAGEMTNQLRLLEKQYRKIEPLIPALDKALPRTKNQTEVLMQIQKLAVRSGLELPGATLNATTGVPTPISQTAKDSDVLAMPVNFQLTGSYEQMRAFLQGLEGFNRYSKVTSLNVSRIEGRPKSLTFSIKLNVYMKP
jgi:Tfp pilus assembly protein PilO